MNLILWDNGKERGPFDSDSLQKSIQTGDVSPKMLARLETGKDWKPLESFFPKPKPEVAQSAASSPRLKPSKAAAIALTALLLIGAAVVGSRFMSAHNLTRAESQRKAAAKAIVGSAITELKKLNSATVAGLTYPEYSRRVLDTKVSLDAIIQRIPPTNEDKATLEEIMEIYLAARDFWALAIRNTDESGIVFVPKDEREKYRAVGVPFSYDIAVPSDLKLIWARAASALNALDARVNFSLDGIVN